MPSDPFIGNKSPGLYMKLAKKCRKKSALILFLNRDFNNNKLKKSWKKPEFWC